ncbi:MAG TPA: CYTH and CHAD domain-containing protein, partial [Acidimicrobiales bacterium]|nr:CYTH and CHAD domain-containing protein [Acidimicrobiales bacterium]
MSTPPGARGEDHLEREVKLEAGLDLALPDLRPLVGTSTRLPERRLETVYFDTAEMRLFDRGMSLRHRAGEGPSPGTWTLKLPERAGPSALERRELSWPGGPDEVPGEARRLVAAVVRNANLQAVVELHTLRRPLELRDGAGRVWAELDDDTVTVRGGPRDGLRFREVEVELTDGAPGDRPVEGRPGGHVPERAGDLEAVLRALEAAGARRHEVSKLATALGRDGSPAPRPEPGRRAALEAVVRHTLGSGLDRLLDQDVRIRLEPSRPPVAAVHQARVATRRLRSDLKTFRPALDEVWVRHVRDELRVVGTALGRVRDLDVLAETLRAAGEPAVDAVGLRELLARVDGQRRAAAEALAERMADPHYLRLLDRIDAAAQSPPFRSGRAGRTASRPSRRRPGP